MNAIEIDTTRLPLLLHNCACPRFARLWPELPSAPSAPGWLDSHVDFDRTRVQRRTIDERITTHKKTPAFVRACRSD